MARHADSEPQPRAWIVPEASRPTSNADQSAGRLVLQGCQSEGEHGDGEHQGQQRHDEPLGVAGAEVADDGADEVGDQGGGGEDAEGLEPQPKKDPGGAGELEGGQEGK